MVSMELVTAKLGHRSARDLGKEHQIVPTEQAVPQNMQDCAPML